MNFAELIDDLRVELSDSKKTRWDDLSLLSLIRRAIKRVNGIVIRNELPFARKTWRTPFMNAAPVITLPADYKTQFGLFRRDRNKRLQLVGPDIFERAIDYGDGIWTHTTDSSGRPAIEVKGRIEDQTDLHLYYYPKDQHPTDVQDDVINAEQLWDALIGYAALLAKNVDEQEAGFDLQLLTEIESQFLLTYRRNLEVIQHLEMSSL